MQCKSSMGNLFSKEQLQFFYRDQSFIIFLSDYFTTYNVKNIDTDMDIDDEGVDNINIYARILLANVKNFFSMIDELGNRISFSHNKNVQSCKGEIRGVLLINQYAKEIVSRHFPRRYECVQKKKTYGTPENVLICYSLLKIRESMERFLISINDTNNEIKKNFRKSPEYAKIFECIGCCEDYLSSNYFMDCRQQAERFISTYGSNMPIELIEAVENRLRDDRVINTILYRDIVEWIKKFIKHGITFISPNVIETMRYDDAFADLLFELWTLYRLENVVAQKAIFDTTEYYKFNRSDGVIFKCQCGPDIIEFIYQKGKGVYWDDNYPVSWRYTFPLHKSLVGKPDITIRVSGSKKRLIMFDAKNRIRENGQVSEEVYKMIGYFDNFREIFEGLNYSGTPKECMLFFRGDETPFIKELVKGNSDYCIRTISVSPTFDSTLNDNQFDYIANAVLNIIK